jgi:MFS superfamily sulfate permease-like transporter
LAITTASVVVVAGVEQGILLAIVLSLLRVVQHRYHPPSRELDHSSRRASIWGDVIRVAI